MSAEPKARLLDVTRLVSRIGRGPLTGVDRVERAYLQALLARHTPLFLLLQTPYGYIVLPRAAGPLILGWIAAPKSVPRPALPFGLGRRLSLRRAVRIALRAHRAASCLPVRLRATIRSLMPQGGVYLNVGLSNLSGRTLSQLQAVPGLRVAVMIHDTIPLDHPEFCRPEAVASFRATMAAVSRHADIVLCPSRCAGDDIARHAASFGGAPRILPAHLGLDPAEPDLDQVPKTIDLTRPYFLALGTIEPRKNHALLLDAWAEMAKRIPASLMPQLLIIGHRGWRNEEIFARLDTLKDTGGPVVELSGLGDAAVAALMMGARALLMPSFAEGFGLPVLEAARMGTPVMCSKLPVFREVLGDYAVYADAGDMYSWLPRIIDHAGRVRAAGPGRILEADVGWAEHFRTVLTVV